MTHQIASALIPFFFSMGAGFFAGKVNPGRMPLSSINTMLVDYALPFALFLYTARIEPADLASHATLIAVLVVVMLAPYFISLALSRLWFRVDLGRAAVRSVTIGMPNFAAVGLPLLHAVFGDDSRLTVALAITTASVVMSPAALILLERAGPRTPNETDPTEIHSKLLYKAFRNTFLKPVVLAPIAGIACAILGWRLPDLATQSLNIVGNTTAGLALFSTGLILAAQPFRLDAEVWVGVALSNVLQPLLALLLVTALGLKHEIAGQAILLSAIPCGSFGILFGLPYGITDTTAGTTLVASSILSAATLSITIFLIGGA
jgi:malonate transporter